MRRPIMGGSCYGVAFRALVASRYGYDPSRRYDDLGFRLTRPTKPSSNTGEDEQPDNPTTHLECT